MSEVALVTKKNEGNETSRDAKRRRTVEFDAYIERAQAWDYDGWKALRDQDKMVPPVEPPEPRKQHTRQGDALR